MFLIVWKSPRLTLDLWQALSLAGTLGFGCAIGVHYAIGYLTLTRLGRSNDLPGRDALHPAIPG